jgi:hypothetical protein
MGGRGARHRGRIGWWPRHRRRADSRSHSMRRRDPGERSVRVRAAAAGGEYLLRRDPKDLERYVAHGGLEWRPARRLVRFGTVAGVRFVAAGDFKASEEQDWKPSVSVRTGFEFDRPRDTDPPGRRWGLLFEAYTGPSPYGQFFRSDVHQIGVGIHFTL